jgi:hypothetical protein
VVVLVLVLVAQVVLVSVLQLVELGFIRARARTHMMKSICRSLAVAAYEIDHIGGHKPGRHVLSRFSVMVSPITFYKNLCLHRDLSRASLMGIKGLTKLINDLAPR